MRLGWLVGNYADPEFRLTRAQKREIGRVAHQRFVARRALTRLTFLVVLPPVLAGFVLLPIGLRALGRAGQNLPFMLGLGVLVLLFWPWSAWAYARLYSGACRRAMRSLGHEVCVGCGYRLEGLPAEAKCPECGWDRCAEA